ncbi:unnamed protein product, partial [Iphiclides podalirius]
MDVALGREYNAENGVIRDASRSRASGFVMNGVKDARSYKGKFFATGGGFGFVSARSRRRRALPRVTLGGKVDGTHSR